MSSYYGVAVKAKGSSEYIRLTDIHNRASTFVMASNSLSAYQLVEKALQHSDWEELMPGDEVLIIYQHHIKHYKVERKQHYNLVPIT